jgi:acetyl-CoA acetyltransferase
MKTYGVSEEEIARVAVLQREHAARNPRAVFYGQPLAVADVINSRYIAKPVHLLDCDMPVNATVAFIVTSSERAVDLRQPPVLIHGWAHGRSGDPSLESWSRYESGVSAICANRLWRLTGLSAKDIHTANLYDGYSIIFLQWLEELGFCGPGQAVHYLAEGHTKLGGAVPMNTAGGALSEGRTHSAGHLAETVLQLRHAAESRQVPGVEVGLVTAGGLQTISSAVVLRR